MSDQDPNISGPENEIRRTTIPTTNLRSNIVLKEDLRGDGRKKLLIIGKTGTGKSTLCNVLTGNSPDSDIFPVSAEAASCTQKTKFCNAHFYGNKEVPVSLIDTIGFDDPQTENDAETIAELVDKLKNACDHINCFVLAVNGQNPRLDGSLVGMIRIFEGIFGPKFWNLMVVVFTRMPMDKKSVRMRKKNAGNKSDEDIAMKYINTVEQKFGKNAREVRFMFIDACYDEEDEDECNHIKESITLLEHQLIFSEGLPTNHIQFVDTEFQKLNKKIEKAEKERKEYQDKAEEERLKKENMELQYKIHIDGMQKTHNEQMKDAKTETQKKELETKFENDRKAEFNRHKAEVEKQAEKNKELDEIAKKRGFSWWDVVPVVGAVRRLVVAEFLRHKAEVEKQAEKNKELDKMAKKRGISWWDVVPVVGAVRRLKLT